MQFSVISRTLIGRWSYPFAKVQSSYSTALAEREVLSLEATVEAERSLGIDRVLKVEYKKKKTVKM